MFALGTRLAIASAALLLAAAQATAQATFRACAQPTQFAAADCPQSAPTLVPVEVSAFGTANVAGDAARATWARASAGPYGLSAESFAVNSGITVSQALAEWTAARLTFAPTPALLALLAPGQTRLELLMHFTATASLNTPPPPAVNRQAVTNVFGTISATGHGYSHGMIGEAEIQNGPFERRVRNEGFLSGLPEAGGSVSFAFPVSLTPGALNGLQVNFAALIRSSVLSTSQPTSAAFWLSLLEGDGAVTLADGTPVSRLGVTYTFTPAPLAGPVATVPEPGTWGLMASGLLLLAATRLRGGPPRRR